MWIFEVYRVYLGLGIVFFEGREFGIFLRRWTEGWVKVSEILFFVVFGNV